MEILWIDKNGDGQETHRASRILCIDDQYLAWHGIVKRSNDSASALASVLAMSQVRTVIELAHVKKSLKQRAVRATPANRTGEELSGRRR